MSKRTGYRKPRILPYALIAFATLTGLVHAGEAVVSGRITYEIRDGVYVDRGADDGLRQDMLGSMQFDDGRILEFEVLSVARKSALLRLAGRADLPKSLIGNSVELVFQRAPQEIVTDDKKTPTSAAAIQSGDKFVPLLAPPEWNVALPRTGNISHGQIRARQMFQTDNEDLLDYSMTRLGSSGSLEKIEGSPWSFEWSGDLAYRAGDAFSRHPDYEDPRLDLYMASLYRPLDEDGFLRFGRFLPRELPGIGYVDGFQGQFRRSDHWRVGAVAGLRPARDNLDPSGDEPILGTYGTLEAGERGGSYYLGTVGLVGSMYKGEADRLALLVDQRASWNSSTTIYSTAQVDFDVGGAESRTGTRLTRLDTSIRSKQSDSLTLRAGVDHWERPDNQAERDLMAIEDDRLFDRGYWRYWVGGDQALPLNLRLSAQVAHIDSPEYDYDPRWNVGLTRRGLFSWPDALVTATIYNLDVATMDGYGGRLSAYLPLYKRTLFVQSLVGFRMLDAKPQSQEFSVSYVSVRVSARSSSAWTLSGGFTHSYGDNVDSTLVDLGLRFAW